MRETQTYRKEADSDGKSDRGKERKKGEAEESE